MYKSYKVFWKAKKRNSKCRECFYLSLIGTSHSDITKKKIGNANKISLIGNIPSNKGLPMTDIQRNKLSRIHTGMTYSEETKRKHRIYSLKKLHKLGIPTKEDVGAKQFFTRFNKENDLELVPHRFFDVGYEADGYDVNKHIWVEYDTPYHFYIDGALKSKDIQRQQNIIEHFEKIGNPLKKFIRVKVDKHRNVLEVKNVYGGGL